MPCARRSRCATARARRRGARLLERRAAGCGSPSSATSARSPPRPGTGSGCRPAPRSCTSRPGRCPAPTSPRCGRHARTSCCSSAAPTGATPRCCCTTPSGIAKARLAAPVVVAGNADAAGRGRRLLAVDRAPVRRHRQRAAARSASWRPRRRGPPSARPSSATSSAARASRAAGGFAGVVRAPTPDAVLRRRRGARRRRGRRRARGRRRRGDDRRLLGARPRRARTPTLHREVVGTLWHARTVEADLGMRWNAEGVVEAGERERIAAVRRHDPVCRRGRGRPGPPRRRRTPVGRRGGDRLDGCGGRGAPARPAAAPVGAAAPARRRRRWSSGPAACCGTRPVTSGDRVLARVTERPRRRLAGARARAPAGGRRLRALRGGAARGRVPRCRGRPGGPARGASGRRCERGLR